MLAAFADQGAATVNTPTNAAMRQMDRQGEGFELGLVLIRGSVLFEDLGDRSCLFSLFGKKLRRTGHQKTAAC